jgi:hypothetical protein
MDPKITVYGKMILKIKMIVTGWVKSMGNDSVMNDDSESDE